MIVGVQCHFSRRPPLPVILICTCYFLYSFHKLRKVLPTATANEVRATQTGAFSYPNGHPSTYANCIHPRSTNSVRSLYAEIPPLHRRRCQLPNYRVLPFVLAGVMAGV